MHDARIGRYRGKFAIIWHDPKLGTQRRSLGIEASPENRSAAGTALEGWKAEQRRAETRPAGPLTVGDCLDRYFEAHPGVIRRGPLRKFFGAMLPEHIDDLICRQFTVSRLAAGRSPSTVHTELGIMRTALIWAKEQKLIDHVPAVEKPERAPARDRWLTPAEAKALIAGAASPHVRLFILVALHTAARAGAILGLTWSRVSFDLNRIDFNDPSVARSRKRRAIIAMTPEIRDILKEAKRAAITDYVIEYAGRRVGSVKRGFERATVRAGLRDVTPHTLRHTAATWMAQRRVPMWEIAGMLGNSVRMVETVYAKHHPDYMQNATSAISDALSQRSAPPVQVNRSGVNKGGKRTKPALKKPSNRARNG